MVGLQATVFKDRLKSKLNGFINYETWVPSPKMMPRAQAFFTKYQERAKAEGVDPLEVFLLSVLADTGTLLLSEVTLAGATVRMEEDFQEILNEGVARLRSLGFDPVAELVRGQPAEEIGKFARQVGADLIVVGHRRQSAFDRWWSGPKGAYLIRSESLPISSSERASRSVRPSGNCGTRNSNN